MICSRLLGRSALFLETFVVAGLTAFSGAALAQDVTAPSASGPTTSADCVTWVDDACIVNDANFTISVTPAIDEAGGSGVDPSGYEVCRSNDTLGWAGCDAGLTFSGQTSWTVTGADRPAPGIRRAYYFRSRDNAGNWGAWNTPIYIRTATADTIAPSAPGTPTTSCVSWSGDQCQVGDSDFTLSASAATDTGGSGVNAAGYEVCRSNDTTGWGGCDYSMTQGSGTSFIVTGANRPGPGKRRAYYFRARDNAGNWGPWDAPIFVFTLNPGDAIPPGAPGTPSSAQCVSFQNGTCLINPGSFTLSVSAAVDDAAGSGTDPNGYNFCRSVDTSGWGGCDVTLSTTAQTSFTVSAANAPAPGQRRAYYVRAKDQAGNYGPWDNPLYVQASADTTPPSVVPNPSATYNGAPLTGQVVNTTTPAIRINWGQATDNVGVTQYNIALQDTTSGVWLASFNVPYPTGTFSGSPTLAEGGTYQIWIRALDAAGNAGPFASMGTLRVSTDTTPPTAVGAFGAKLDGRDIAGQQVPWNNPQVDLSWAAPTDAGGIKQYTITLERADGSGSAGAISAPGVATSATFASDALVVGTSYRFAIDAVDNAGNAGPVVRSGSFTIAPSLMTGVQSRVELVITALPVVEDPVRTTGCGAWTFCAMMTALAGTQDPAAFTDHMLALNDVNQSINGDTIAAQQVFRSNFTSLWPRFSDGRLDLAHAPLKLLAIVNRADLVKPGDAGEARMVYGWQDGKGHEITFIIEYRMSTDSLSRAQWWSEWHRLTQNNDQTSEAYKSQLQYVTDRFARTPVNGKISLGQLRQNHGLFSPGLGWEFREFIQPQANGPMVQTTVKQTPRQIYQNSATLGDWINTHEAEILTGTHVVGPPIELGGADFLVGFDTPDNVRNKTAGMLFSKSTCSGCHIMNTLTQPSLAHAFFQINPRDAGQEAKLSNFFFNVPLCGDMSDAGTCQFPYTQNELGRRAGIFQQDLGIIGFMSKPAAKVSGRNDALKLHEPSDAEVVTLDSLTRVH